MPKTRSQKKTILKDLNDKIDQSKAIYFAKFNAFGVKDNEDLRKELKKEKGEYLVAKKTLLKLALENNKIEIVNPRDFDGQVATIFGYEDQVMPAKVIDKFKEKVKDKIEFVGGILDGRYYNAKEVEALAKLPGKQELLAKLVGSLNAPVSGFVNALAGNLRNLVYVLKAIEEKK